MLLGKGALFGDLPFRPGFFLPNEQAIASGMSCVIEVGRQELENQAVASVNGARIVQRPANGDGA
jgi:hypothetical protein